MKRIALALAALALTACGGQAVADRETTDPMVAADFEVYAESFKSYVDQRWAAMADAYEDGRYDEAEQLSILIWNDFDAAGPAPEGVEQRVASNWAFYIDTGRRTWDLLSDAMIARDDVLLEEAAGYLGTFGMAGDELEASL